MSGLLKGLLKKFHFYSRSVSLSARMHDPGNLVTQVT